MSSPRPESSLSDSTLRVLVVDDDEVDAMVLVRALGRAWPAIHHARVSTRTQLERALREASWDVVLCDHRLAEIDAHQVLATLEEQRLTTPLIVVAGAISEDAAVRVLQAGARDCLHKNDPARLVEMVRRELRTRATIEALEQQIRRAQKMEAVGRLAGGIAHDFNNVMGVVIGGIELVQMRLQSDAVLFQLSEEILEAAQRATDLTGKLLAFSRDQAATRQVVELNALLTKSKALFVRAVGSEVALSIELSERECPVLVDPVQLDQVLLSLVVNACDAMPSGGELSISLRRTPAARDFMRLPGVRGREIAELSVTDTGVGMSADVLQHIFEPFFTTKTAKRGSGLGLATSQEIVKQSGGVLTVESAPGEGTTFHIHLPLVREPPSDELERSLGERPES